MTLNTYLTFENNCREAFEFYRSVFGGEFSEFQTFGDGPPDMGIPEEAKQLVMHVSLPVGESILMGSDSNPAFGPGPLMGTNFSISYVPAAVRTPTRSMRRSRTAAKLRCPCRKCFWGAYFGTCTDRFGIAWMINFDPQPAD